MTRISYASSQARSLTVLAFTAAIAMVILIYGANGIRGTDQYWYLADVETLAKGNAPLINTTYPGKILREIESGSTPNYFMHNGPMLHLIASISENTNPYTVWILLNALSHLVVAFIIFLISRAYTEKYIAVWLTAIYLTSPIAIWQTLNMLQEQFYAGLFALSILWLAFPRAQWLQIVSSVFLVVGICSHPIFLILGIFNAVAWCTQGALERKPFQIAVGLCLGTLYCITKYFSGYYFPSSFQPSLTAIISGSIPGKSNMLWHYTDVQIEVSVALLWDKFIFAVREHLFSVRNLPFYIYTNLALILMPVIILFGLKKYPRTLLFAILLGFGSYLSILTLMQTQARYQQIVATISFVTIAFAIKLLGSKFRIANFQRYFEALALTLILLNTSVSMFLANTAQEQSTSERAAMNALSSIIASIPRDSRILMLDSTEHELKLSYALKPRKILAARTDLIDSNSLSIASKSFNPTHVISLQKIKSELVGNVHIKAIHDDYFGTIYFGTIH